MQTRNSRGQFARKSAWTILIFFFVAIMVSAIYGEHWVTKELNASNGFSLATPVFAGETMEAKVAHTKDELVESLAKECETKSAKEPDAVIILDTNNEMSIGAFQYQIKTIQQYEKQLFGKDISRVEAIQIAIDHKQASELTKAILFTVAGGWQNWRNCASKLDLPIQIQLLKSLDN